MKGICFIEPLFHAVVSGTKIQTRRIVRPQIKDCSKTHQEYIEADWRNEPMSLIKGADGSFFCRYCGNGINFQGIEFIKPKYKVGEKVYLKEPYRHTGAPKGHFAELDYLYDKTEFTRQCCPRGAWKNKLFMPQKYARYFIEIAAVRCERLQDISNDDCMREGIGFKDVYEKIWSETPKRMYFDYSFKDFENWLVNTPKEAYAALIDQINGKDTWESNPYVFVYDFKLVK